MSYNAQQSVVGTPITGVFDAYNVATGAQLFHDVNDWTGKLTDTMGMNHSEPFTTPGRVRYVAYFRNAAKVPISPVWETFVQLNETSRHYSPPTPTATQVTVNHFYHHYRVQPNGTYQLQVACTYRAGANWIGRQIRLVTEIRLNGQTALLHKEVDDPFVVKAEYTLITKTNMTPLGNPPSVDLTMYIVDAANPSVILSPVKATFIDADINGRYPG
jgi:hypothetical protein